MRASTNTHVPMPFFRTERLRSHVDKQRSTMASRNPMAYERR